MQQQIFKSEIIGAQLEVVGAKNESLLGKKGKVVDETKNTIILEGNVSILKDQVIVSIESNDQKLIIDGKLLIGRSEERLKKQ